MGGPKSVDHLGPDPPPTGDLITASACPITDVGALLAVDRCAARADKASSARSSGSPTCIHPWLQMLAQFLGVLGGEVDLVADGIVKLLTLFGGCEDWSLWRLRRGTRATGIRSRSSGTRCGC